MVRDARAALQRMIEVPRAGWGGHRRARSMGIEGASHAAGGDEPTVQDFVTLPACGPLGP
jgi:hypothetical protein